HSIRKNKRRRSHARHANPLTAKILHTMNRTIHSGLHAQAAFMNTRTDFHIKPLFNRLEKIHHKVMCDVIPAKREHIFVIRPFAFNELNIEPFFLEESVYFSAE